MKILFIWLVLIFSGSRHEIPAKGLLVDLNADKGIVTAENNRVESWKNSVEKSPVDLFVKRDEGRKVPGSGRPALKENLAEINGHNTVLFLKQELLNKHESACDSLITGKGWTWITVLKPLTQSGELKDVNSFFGTLRNGGRYEGFWAGFTDDNRLWSGGRNGITFGRWDENNPLTIVPTPLDTTRYYLLAGRMAAGTGTVSVDIFVNDLVNPAVSGSFIVNPLANSSMLAIGQERDAIEHPGVESFNGEIARFLLYDRPLTASEMRKAGKQLMKQYALKR